MKKSMYREMYNMPPLEEVLKAEEEAKTIKSEPEVKERGKIIIDDSIPSKKEGKKKNGRKFTI